MIPLNSILNPSSWKDPTWMSYMTELKIDPSQDRLHRKKWEITQTMYGLDKLGCINEKNAALDVEAGTEPIMFHMANRVKKIIAIDLYDFEDRGLFPYAIKNATISKPWKFAKIPYRREHLEVKRMDARELEFDDSTFDFVFSISSIEHFGGHKGSQKSMEEIARVLKPGGVASITTELILNEMSHPEFFTQKELEEFLIRPSKLKLIDPIKFNEPSLESYIKNPLLVPEGRNTFPHLVLTQSTGVIFTSITFFLKKPLI